MRSPTVQGVTVQPHPGGRLDVRYRRFRWVAAFLLPVGVLWLTLALVIGRGSTVGVAVSLVFAPALLYWAVVHVFGSVVVRVEGERLRTLHRPLPWWPTRDVPVAEVRSLGVSVKRSRDGQSGALSSTYRLDVETRDGRVRTLVGGVEHADQAHAMRTALEARLAAGARGAHE